MKISLHGVARHFSTIKRWFATRRHQEIHQKSLIIRNCLSCVCLRVSSSRRTCGKFFSFAQSRAILISNWNRHRRVKLYNELTHPMDVNTLRCARSSSPNQFTAFHIRLLVGKASFFYLPLSLSFASPFITNHVNQTRKFKDEFDVMMNLWP